MKITNIHSLLIWLSICIISCEKPNNAAADPNNIPGLPPATQSGANTFGCLVNGVPWVPAGYTGSVNNLSIDYDPLMGNGYFSIAAYNAKPTSLTYVILGIRDSVNFIANGKEINIGKNFLGASLYDESSICSRYSDDNLVYSFGKINITKYDKNTRILSGVFNCVLYNRSCGDTIKITNGRFDFKF